MIHKRVNAALMRRAASGRGRLVRQEVLDLVQEVFVALFENDGRVLESWDPARGRSFTSFVGLVAEREVASILRSGRRSPWTEDPTEASKIDVPTERETGPDARAASRERLARVLDALRERTSPLGLAMFEALYVEQHPPAEVARTFDMKPDAVYAWRSRLGKLVRRLAAELS